MKTEAQFLNQVTTTFEQHAYAILGLDVALGLIVLHALILLFI